MGFAFHVALRFSFGCGGIIYNRAEDVKARDGTLKYALKQTKGDGLALDSHFLLGLVAAAQPQEPNAAQRNRREIEETDH
ncbi:MAG TPA: hypothetical protein PLP17_16095, partial [Oligoflexia bacterium]|nr:hypothetical protein [Oligoflexia bacterium]